LERPAIGIDMDGVTYPWVKAVYTHWKMYYGYTGDEYYFYQNVDNILSKEEQDYIVTIPQIYTSFVPENKLIQLLNKLGEKFSLYYITARPECVRRVTENYLRDFHFPQDTNLIFSKDKDTMARLLKLDYFVEDSVKNAEKLKNICTTFLVKTPYNETYSGEVPMIDSLYCLEEILL
jgi:uncharacterized HAD superfamily protein